MTQLVKINDKGMMSSKHIAERTGKEHSNVLRDIRNMISELQKDGSNLNSPDYQVVMNENTGLTAEILLNERLSLCLASGYSITLRMMIIDDWARLKAPKELSKKEIILLALESEERALAAEAKLLEQQPKVEAFDRVIDNSTTYTLDTVSDIINVGRTKLSDKLKQIGWATKDSSKGTSSTRKVEEVGYARTFFETIKRGSQEIKVKKIVITKKGLDYLVNNYSKIFA